MTHSLYKYSKKIDGIRLQGNLRKILSWSVRKYIHVKLVQLLPFLKKMLLQNSQLENKVSFATKDNVTLW